MGWELVLALFFGALLFLMLTGMNVFVAFLIVNLGATALLIGPSGFGLFTNSIFSSATTGAFATIPLFILMGEVLFRSGSVNVLFDSVDRLIGQVKGRLYFVVILIATIFGALSGSAIAVTAMLGRSALPNMVQRGYSTRLSASVILVGASLAPIIPPSLLAVIVGSLADVSIAGLLIAGIVPGMIIAGVTALYVVVAVAKNPELAPAGTEATEYSRPGAALLRMLPFLLIIFMVMGLILLGIATPGESAATGVVGSVVVAAIYRRLNLSMLGGALQSATRISVMLLIIVISSTLFSQLVAFSGASKALVEWATQLEMPRLAMFALLMLLPLVLCMFIDQVAFLLMAVPLYGPLVAAFDFDPIWFWTMFLINLTVGGVTPPFGYTLFALVGSASEVKTGLVFRASLPVIAIFVVAMIVLTFAPGLVTWLPGLF